MTKHDLIKAIESLTVNSYLDTDDLEPIYDVPPEEIQQILRDYGEIDHYEYIDLGNSGRLVPLKRKLK